MAPPADMPQVPPEHWKQPEHLDAEEGQAEDMRRTRKPARQHCAGHQRRVCTQRRGELDPHTAAVVEEEYVDAHEPAGHCPDRIAGGGFRQGFQDGREAEKRNVDQDSRLGRCEAGVGVRCLAWRGRRGG